MSEKIVDFSIDHFVLPVLQDFYDRISSRGINRQDITGLLVRLLTSYFSNPENIKYNEIKQRVWKPGDDTGILIESVGRFRPELAEKRPAILVRPGEWKKIIQGLQSELISTDTYQPNKRYILVIQGSHNIIVVSKNPAETEILSDEVFKFLDLLKIVAPATTPIDFLRVLGISELKPLAEQRTHYYSVIPLVYNISQTYNVSLIVRQ